MQVLENAVNVPTEALLLDIDDENNSDCSEDDDEDTIVMPLHISIDDTITVPVRTENRRSVILNRLSCKFVPLKDVKIDRPAEISGMTFDKIDEMIAKFPQPPTHVPRAQETVAPTYSQMSSAALKAVNFGFGSLKRGVDKLVFFSPKK